MSSGIFIIMRFVGVQLFLCLSLMTAAYSEYTFCDSCTNRASRAKLEAMEIRLFTGSTIDEYTRVKVGNASELLTKIKKSKPTAIYTHGWKGSPNGNIVRLVISAYLAEQNHNIMLFDWSNVADNAYSYAQRSVEGVGYVFACTLNEMVACGLETLGLHLIGHSLGAHVFGYTGRHVNFTLDRITGLDPAGPGFKNTNNHLTTTNAELVQVIHSNAGTYGIDSQIGHADFYPNGGSKQPGCLAPVSTTMCNHNRAPIYFAESLGDPYSFMSLKCDSYEKFKAGSCSSAAVVAMGDGIPTNASGRFYLETNSASPYGRKENGTKF